MNLLFSLSLLIVGFAILVKGADWLVDGSANLARRFHISELVIGLTIVAFGTSAPELIVNVLASIQGYNAVAYGNIIGSNIFNILLILGVTGIIYPLAVQRQTIRVEIPLSLLFTLVLFFLVNDVFWNHEPGRNVLSRTDAVILLVLEGGFLWYLARNMKSEDPLEPEAGELFPLRKAVLFISIGLIGLIAGGKLVVDHAMKLAIHFGMSEKLIGLTIVSIGTSLPELVTSVVSALKRNTDIAIGNVVGSNIFNILLILGLGGLIHPIPYDPVMNTDIYVLIGATIFLLVFMFTFEKRKVDRSEAILMLLAYIGYSVFLFYRN